MNRIKITYAALNIPEEACEASEEKMTSYRGLSW